MAPGWQTRSEFSRVHCNVQGRGMEGSREKGAEEPDEWSNALDT